MKKKLQDIESNLIDNDNYFFIRWNDKDLFTCSNAFQELIGFKSEYITKLPFKHLSLASDSQGENIYNSVINISKENNSQGSKIDYSITAQDGKLYWFREYINYSENTDDNIFDSLIMNITDLKNKEVELQETISEKSSLNEAKDKLISIISHDLRSPFSSLLGFSEILLNEPNLPEEERVEYLEYIRDASKIQLQMVNHLLDWTRLQTGNMKINFQRLDIKDIIDNCVSVLTGNAIRKDIEIKVNGNNNNFVSADERLINQVVTNLLSNAVKFTPSGKKIYVDIKYFKDSMIEVVVKDEGVGIDEKNQQKLFKIESKFSQAGTAGEKGSGLGLSLVKEIIEKHNGDIWFYSELEKGSEFHFTLPKSEDTILIVEEHEEIQNTYIKSFRALLPGYKLHFCSNGFEALNFVVDKTPAAVITYHNMSLMNGIQIVSSLRKNDTQNRVPVIILTDDLEEEVKNNYMEFKVKNFKEVNSSPEQLGDLLLNLIGD